MGEQYITATEPAGLGRALPRGRLGPGAAARRRRRLAEYIHRRRNWRGTCRRPAAVHLLIALGRDVLYIVSLWCRAGRRPAAGRLVRAASGGALLRRRHRRVLQSGHALC